MFRTNADTSLIFQQSLWLVFGEQIGSGDLTSLDDVASAEMLAAFHNALYEACDDAFDAERILPNGMTLAELAQDEFPVLQDHATTQIDALATKAEQPGVDVVLLFLTMRGAGSCSRWWGAPHWPAIVDTFIALLTDPNNDWWHHHRSFPTLRPAEAEDLDRLRYLLLARPYRLSYEAADFCIDNGIGFVQLERPPR